jgi:hypothetical protein
MYGDPHDIFVPDEIVTFNCEHCHAEYSARKTFKEVQQEGGITDVEWYIS